MVSIVIEGGDFDKKGELAPAEDTGVSKKKGRRRRPKKKFQNDHAGEKWSHAYNNSGGTSSSPLPWFQAAGESDAEHA